MENTEPPTPSTVNGQNTIGSAFRHVRSVMQRPVEISYAAPWTEEEFELYARQEQLPPNQVFQLPAEEFPSDDNNENQNQLHLNYNEY